MQLIQKLKTRQIPPGLTYIVLLICFFAAAVFVGTATFRMVRKISAAGNPFQLQPANLTGKSPLPGDPGEGDGPFEEQVPGPSGPEPIPWDGAGRVTVLVVGLDYRDWESGEGPPRTDTMILLTVDPLAHSAGILNIPRDLWVNIPGSGYGKINTAYPIGEGSRLPGGGPGLAVKTVEQFIGVPINFYAQIDFSAFEQFIDEIGGIELDVPAEITVDPIGPGNTVKLEPGRQNLDGPVALAYARARNTEGADFDRAVRQQQVIFAMLDRLLKPNFLPTLISKAPVLYKELASGVNTNMTLEQAIQMAWLAPQIDRQQIKRGVIGPPDQVLFAKSPDGTMDILKPIPSKIRLLRDEIFAGDVFSPAMEKMELEELMQTESASISVLNGSGVGGLAGRTSEYLQAAGSSVIVTGDAGQLYSATTVIDYTGNPYTLRYLAQLMGIQPAQIKFEFRQDSELDVVVFLGSDWAANNPLP